VSTSLFGGKTLRFSDLERAIPGISQKMLAQQLQAANISLRSAFLARAQPEEPTTSLPSL
jgi:hypothetical protein